MKSMFELLTELPLFRGVTRERMAQAVGTTKFHFLKYPAGETVVSEGDHCSHVRFIISGKVRLSIRNSDGRFIVSQTLTAPDVISPEFLFGRNTIYPGTAKALEDAGILQIAKQDYIKILNSDNIFLFNYLNMLSVIAQKSVSGILSLTGGSLEERIAFWVIGLTQPGSTEVSISCRHRDLYTLFGVQRSAFIAVLDHMKEKGLIEYDKNTINVLDRRLVCEMILPRTPMITDDDEVVVIPEKTSD